MAAIERAMRVACSSLSITHGPAMNASGAPPRVSSRSPTGTLRGAAGSAPGRPVPLAGMDEAPEKGMGLHRLRLELGVELAGHEVRVIGDLDDLDEALVGRLARDLETAALEILHVLPVHLVTVPVALADLGPAVGLLRRAPG